MAKQRFWKVGDEDILCGYCGIPFRKPTGRAKLIYCSIPCSNKARGGGSAIPTLTCEQCHKVFQPYNSRPHKYCSRNCQFQYLRGRRHPLWRGNRRHERGITWRNNAIAARQRDSRCVAIGCGKTEVDLGQRLSVDHLVPFRQCQSFDGADPNHLDNLNCLCRAHHSRKTRAEPFLLSGEIGIFIQRISCFLPADRIDRAMRLWNIDYLHNGGKPCPPKGGA